MDHATRQTLAEEIGVFLHANRSIANTTMLFIGFFDRELYSISVYEDEGGQLKYVSSTGSENDAFWDKLIKIWKAQPPKHQWQTLEAILEGEEIKLFFFYADKPLGRGENFPEREPIIRKYFGDKPVYYPPLSRKGPEDLGFEL